MTLCRGPDDPVSFQFPQPVQGKTDIPVGPVTGPVKIGGYMCHDQVTGTAIAWYNTVIGRSKLKRPVEGQVEPSSGNDGNGRFIKIGGINPRHRIEVRAFQVSKPGSLGFRNIRQTYHGNPLRPAFD